jgi:hypothetical protein
MQGRNDGEPSDELMWLFAEGKKVKKKPKLQEAPPPPAAAAASAVDQAGSPGGEDLRVELYEDAEATR